MVLHESATELVSQLTKDGEERNDDEEEREQREPSEDALIMSTRVYYIYSVVLYNYYILYIRLYSIPIFYSGYCQLSMYA